MANKHYRCRVCRARQVKSKWPHEYIRVPKCVSCGNTHHRDGDWALAIDKWHQARKWRKYTCRCDGYHFPHRIRSEWCYHNPNHPMNNPEHSEN